MNLPAANDSYDTNMDFPTLSVLGKQWYWRTNQEREGLALAQKLGLPSILGRILVGRGIGLGQQPVAEAADFLSPKLQDLPDPNHLLDMDVGVNRLQAAIKQEETIAIFGDYDVDGSCATSILARYLRELGLQPIFYIPDRLTEGYGPNPSAMRKLKEQGATLLITVDCGSLSFEALAEAKKRGLDVIVTDHHQTQPERPPCVALINPNRVDEHSACTMLCGAGVAFYLLMALNRHLRKEGFFENKKEPDLKALLDLVAVATLCDMVPLTGVNRVLVQRGLAVLNQRQNKGLSALMGMAGLQEEDVLTPYDVGFKIGPRLNAGGRIGKCDMGATLLATEDDADVQNLAQKLQNLNMERKTVESDVLDDAWQIAGQQLEKSPSVLVVKGQGWHPGVIGIVAARLKEKYHRPVIVLSENEEGLCKGSGRGVTGLDLGRAVIECRDILVDGGGHAMAAGLTVRADAVEAFTKKINECLTLQAQKVLEEEGRDVFVPRLALDAVVTPAAANMDLAQALDKMEPAGVGNPTPRFMIQGRLAYTKAVGSDGSHVQVRIQGNDGKVLSGIAFRAMEGPLGGFLNENLNKQVTLAGTLDVNTWQGVSRLQLKVEDACSKS